MDLETRQYIETLDLDSLARWMCLLQGIDFIFQKLQQDEKSDDFLFRSKKSFNILQRSLIKYIDERFEAMRSDIIIDCKKPLH